MANQKNNYENCQNRGKKINSGKFCSNICENVYNKNPKGTKPLEAIEQQNQVQKYCKNPQCGKEIPNGQNYCNEECLRKHLEIKREARNKPQIEEYPRRNGKNTEQTVNTGTENKSLLQEQSLRFMKNYPKDRTARQYACLLCWDIRVSQRTAMESYIEPMIAHGILVPSGNNQFRLSPEYE